MDVYKVRKCHTIFLSTRAVRTPWWKQGFSLYVHMYVEEIYGLVQPIVKASVSVIGIVE